MTSPRVAAYYSFYGKPQTLYKPIFFKCLQAVIAAGRGIPASAAKPGRYNPLVYFY